jgi:HEPN domain-containing protein
MLPNEAIAKETGAWLRKVEVDLRGADLNLAADPPVLENVVFHSQQAVEKVFKAFLTWHDLPFQKTHNLRELGGQCEEVDPSLLLLKERAAPLTKYAWLYRYPGDEESPTLDEAQRALAIAREVVAAVRDRISLPPESAV